MRLTPPRLYMMFCISAAKGAAKLLWCPTVPDRRKSHRGRPAVQAALGLGTNMMAAFLLFGLGGHLLDRRSGGGYRWTICGVLLAMVFCGVEVWRLVRRMDEEEQEQRNASKDS